MSYRCGLDAQVAYMLGVEPGPPHITCDGCGRRLLITARRGQPPKWFLDNKAAPGWRLDSVNGTREDFCKECK